jgi:tight adherence protein C
MGSEQLLAVAFVFVAVALATGAVAFLALGRSTSAQRRLQEVTEAAPALRQAPVMLLDGQDPALARFSRFVPKSPKEMGRIQKRLARAGHHSTRAAIVYALSELALPVLVGGGIFYWLGTRRGLLFGALAAFVAYLLPSFVLSHLIEKRKKQIANGLPDCLDLLIVCVEAGLGLDQAIQKASEELHITHPAVAEELRMITTEMRAGKPRIEAFRNFADRTKVSDVKSLVAMLAQTDRFGTSIAQALRTFAEHSRIKRRQMAEERAAKLGVKLVFPLVFFLFPAIYVVTLGPAAITYINTFKR